MFDASPTAAEGTAAASAARASLQGLDERSSDRIERPVRGLGLGGGANPTIPDKEKAPMRYPKLTPAATAVAALALAVPAAAAARAHHHGAARHGTKSAQCRVTLDVAPRLVTSGETALAFGQGSCPAAGPEAGQTVTLFEHAAGAGGFTAVGTATTDAHGFYQLTTPALTQNSTFYATLASARSASRNVNVMAQVTLEGPPEGKSLSAGIRTGRRNAVMFKGNVSPKDSGALVVLQRQNEVRGRGWHSIGHGVVDSEGAYAITHIFRVPGASDIRVVVHSNKRNVVSPSNTLSYDISQAQNPSLTIFTSADPISYGGSVVISGVAAGAPHAPLTLLGRDAHGAFAPVATTTSDGEGKYAFPAQTTLASTLYRVKSANRSSAALYQGVKYVLSANPATTTVTSGQPFSVSGTVTPARAGHEIYLQRLNAAGTSYHVVAVGSVAADGSYTISHTFYAPGTDSLRVKIPGDPENGGTASAPFNLAVTPVPSAAALKPEPKGNSSQPPQGQL